MTLAAELVPHTYRWPLEGSLSRYRPNPENSDFVSLPMPEPPESLAQDSRWPAFFPSPLCFVTTGAGGETALEKVVGASIVNRFPYIIALSFCRRGLSRRHHPRTRFMSVLERAGTAVVQLLPPGPALDAALKSILGSEDSLTSQRIAATGLETVPAATNRSPVFRESYLVYEARLVEPRKDFDGEPILASPWVDLGSHRVYFLEITCIQLREDIARGQRQIRWRSLPTWSPVLPAPLEAPSENQPDAPAYTKGYTPHYAFPGKDTVAFEWDELSGGMALKHQPPLPEDQVEVDNDRARWPCFFPSSAGVITAWGPGGVPNAMPCGSTTIVSRSPMIISPCVSYARINIRYAKRASLDIIRSSGRFGCGVPYVSDDLLRAIRYSGNVSLAADRNKFRNSGLTLSPGARSPLVRQLPIHFDCEVVGEQKLGTHVMFFGEVREIHIRRDVTPGSPLEWCPWPSIA